MKSYFDALSDDLMTVSFEGVSISHATLHLSNFIHQKLSYIA